MSLIEGIQMAVTLNLITLTFVAIIFFFINSNLKDKEKQKKLAKVDNPTKHL